MSAFTAFTLAACATVPEKGDFVPIQTLAAETQDLPFECTGYDAATDSCEGIGQRTINGSTMTSMSLVALGDENGAGTMSFTTKHPIVDGKVCGIIGEPDVKVNGKSVKEGENFMVDFLTGFLTAIAQETCSAYYRSGDHYFIEATGPDGTVLDDFSTYSRFFAEMKTLRAMPLE